MDLKSKIILISGPTASGKSNFSIKLAKKVNGEIINADSMQVYKELKILSARPSPKDYQKIKHHLYGFHSVKKNFSTGDWLKIAIKKVKEIKKRKKIPIFVGGTGLYFKALTDGLVSIPNIPIRYRNNIRDLQKKLGQKKFYQKLIKLDPNSKEKINPTDTQRSIRAYEVIQFTKKPLHDWFQNTKSYFNKDDFFKIYIDYPREELIQRIGKRVEKMIKHGAVKEVRKFIKLKVRKDKSVNKAIGINEIKEYLKEKKDLTDVIEKISIKTRQYAKKQSTWARGNMMSWLKLYPQDLNKYLKKIK
ncbi:tRNA (adenosine(37)-N6)-dimethylallyltransferase MiaA [Candidatus Pelagibacter sp.]|jgi:tRNA dimethylallyltransferase|uniref:tRNA (adenosine(37)-N6)-dimethylallyltransferase MiaA n=1 Tax=uncultured Candidatus Pelagibacter sp. TaxID=372654 RepID=UPI00233A0054|nr:tRNA (adenosine(37)-N6)-dimethylallyltransferase MiaA [uncultured Candidatus Pelagibacter sp.]MDB4351415.1 tRNA (adenosine(37)-N6)-dimethylallyltransferase MiaA [Candidatus Pelagibacter sp.]MDC3216099.1 tRNA (adenosine(37)-N6)-dimethylallyltransferase MiaA [bacterium]MDB4811869.1 tRNA (adenosine(37)-N6)-dimethylallyltransferase MiaA [Candidatus Pelagibacter sp.]MDC0465381.1 tRNA (adenosine(37)-N6)-dimethylallyltransferase MiaA [Candidatus Pelagibacter sp.]MDC1003799.1 tRNA (adenosine(37)-N6